MGTCNCTEKGKELEVHTNGKEPYIHECYVETSSSNRQTNNERIQAIVRSYLTRKSCRLSSVSDSLQSFYKTLPQFNSQELSNFSYFYEGGVYEGEVNEFEIPHGQGKLTQNGIIKEGRWVNGKLNGRCRIVSDNEVFIGEFKDNLKEGYGELKGSKDFKGLFRNDLPHGKGKEVWKNGSSFEGIYFEGKRNGIGVLLWPDGSKYEGEFINNLICGNGEYRSWNGNWYLGSWLNNKMHGHGKFVWNDGKVYEGEYLNNLKSGYGVLTFKEKKYEGMWKNGKQHGEGYFSSKDSMKRGMWYNGKFCG
jgi:hypothetical protein